MRRDDYDSARYDRGEAEDVYSKPVRAGKRTYFFDVKATKGRKDFYLTITESKRRNNPDGTFNYDKHKIFLYKEDFDKFREGLEEVIAYMKSNLLKDVPEHNYETWRASEAQKDEGSAPSPGETSFTDVDFEEL